MKTKSKIWVYPVILMGMVLMFTTSCKKDNSNTNTKSGWSALGGKQDIYGVSDMYVDKTGNLYAAGSFVNSSANYYVAKWDGNSWTNIGEVDGGLPLSLCADANNNVYAGTDARVFEWNGNNWTALNMTGFAHWVDALLIDASGNLYVGGGALVGSGGSVAKWNGDGWSEIGTLNAYEEVHTICMDAGGTLYAGGGFSYQSGYVVKWDGNNWTDLGLNGNDLVNSICTDGKGNLYAGGDFYNSNNKIYVAKWDGSNWIDLGLNAYNGISKLVFSNNKLYAGGNLEFELNDGEYIAVYQ